MVYMTAFLVPRGKSLFGVLGEFRPANMVLEVCIFFFFFFFFSFVFLGVGEWGLIGYSM